MAFAAASKRLMQLNLLSSSSSSSSLRPVLFGNGASTTASKQLMQPELLSSSLGSSRSLHGNGDFTKCPISVGELTDAMQELERKIEMLRSDRNHKFVMKELELRSRIKIFGMVALFISAGVVGASVGHVLGVRKFRKLNELENCVRELERKRCS